MKQPKPDTNEPPTEGQVVREVAAEFLRDANEGQIEAYISAARRAWTGEKARPLRELVRDLDAANGGLVGRAFGALFNNNNRSPKQ